MVSPRHRFILLGGNSSEGSPSGDIGGGGGGGSFTDLGKWSLMHLTRVGITALPDATAGLAEGQKAMMLGAYSDHDY